MTTEEQIAAHIAALPEPKAQEMQALHQMACKLLNGGKLWFYNGKNDENKTVANPAIGYGSYLIKYANGKTMEWFQVGISANKTGISVYVMGLKDMGLLKRTFGEKIGKAGVSGYCIKFKKLEDINTETLAEAIRFGLEYKAG